MSELSDILDDTDFFLDDLVQDHRTRLLKAIRKIENRVIDLAKELPTTRKFSVKLELKRLQGFHKEMVKEFEQVYGEAIGAIVDDYAKVEKRALKELKWLEISDSYTTADKDVFELLRQQYKGAFSDMGIKAQNQIAQAVYDAAVGAGKFSGLVEDFRNILTGVEGKGGRPLASYAEMYAHDSIMGHFRKIHKYKAEKAGINTFLYYGNIMKTSRAFCIARAGKTYTEEQILSWEELTWKGKAPGDIFVVCGGHR